MRPASESKQGNNTNLIFFRHYAVKVNLGLMGKKGSNNLCKSYWYWICIQSKVMNKKLLFLSDRHDDYMGFQMFTSIRGKEGET